MLWLELPGGSIGHTAIGIKESSVLLVIPRVHLTQFGQLIGASEDIKNSGKIGTSIARIEPTELIEWNLHLITKNGHGHGHVDHCVIVTGEEQLIDRFLDRHLGTVHL